MLKLLEEDEVFRLRRGGEARDTRGTEEARRDREEHREVVAGGERVQASSSFAYP